MTTPHAPARDDGLRLPEHAGEALEPTQATAAVDEVLPVDPTEATSLGPPVNVDVVDVAAGLRPGWALDLGCGRGQNAIWLAQRGWRVLGIDISPDAIADARDASRASAAAVVLGVEDITSWTPGGQFDLVVSTFALPPRGSGRGRALEMAVGAVAAGGTILISDLDASLRSSGWIAERHLTSIDELSRYVDGFRINRADVRLSRHRFGHDERVLPVATIVATRRTDLRRF